MKREAYGLRLKWLGCACFEMDFGGLTVVSDPWITDNAATELTWEAVERCDYITLTHGHYDHILDIPRLVKKFDPRVLCGDHTAPALARYADMIPMRVYPMHPDLELDLESVKVKALFGRHTLKKEPVSARMAHWQTEPVVCGSEALIELQNWGDMEYRNYLFTAPNGTKVLLWGNTTDMPEQRAMLRRLQPDIAIVQVTRTSPAAELARLCREMGGGVVIPHHIDFPRDYAAQAQALGQELEKQAPDIRYILPAYGQWMEL